MRKSGILMHISSLPGPYGIGSMGKCAYDFADFLCKAGQSYWQILPLSPTGYGDSPYQSFSIFAGNPYLIDLDALIESGLLNQEEVDAVKWFDDEKSVDYGCLYENRGRLLMLAYQRYTPDESFDSFVKDNPWLENYSLFMALKEYFGGVPWQNWPEELVLRDEAAMNEFREKLSRECGYHSFVQYIFYSQWQKLRAYANSKGLSIIGDVPIYVPLDCADVWASPRLFQLDEHCRPTGLAGCPPDSFCADGQFWGNPLYNWDIMKEEGYAWWIERLDAAQRMYDIVRFDHFRGFESYWAIPADAATAAEGKWVIGPGMDFISAVQKGLPGLDCIAEDLGYVTPEVRQLQEDSGYPGMKVLEFAFDSHEEGNYLPYTYPVNSMCYSGTHDNLTLKQWMDEAIPADRQHAIDYLGLNEGEGYIKGLIRGCMASVSRMCIIQMQDYLELGAEGRMNSPGTLGTNWTWRAEAGFDSDELAAYIRTLTERYGRI